MGTRARGGCLQGTTPLKSARTEARRALDWSEWQIAIWAQEIHLQLTQLGPAGVAPRSGLGRGEHIYFSGQWAKPAGCFKTRKT